MASYFYALAPWVWDPSRACWNPPASCVGAIDLGSLPSQSVGGSDRAIGFFACTTAVAGRLNTTAGDLRSIAATNAMRDAFLSLAGYRPQGSTLMDLLSDSLLNGDPSGGSRVAPLEPETGGELAIWLPGHSKIWSEPFRWGAHRHTNRLRDRIRNSIGAVVDSDPILAEKMAGAYASKYLGRWNAPEALLMLPPRARANGLRSRRLGTSFSDDFSGSLAEWTQVSGSWSIVSGGLAKTANVNVAQFIRYNSPVSSADHDVSVKLLVNTANMIHGPACRFSGAAATCYVCGNFAGANYLTKYAPGQTNLANVSYILVANDVFLTGGSGSTIYGKVNGVVKNQVTDTSLTATLGGLTQYASSASASLDNFLIDDYISAAAGYCRTVRCVQQQQLRNTTRDPRR